MPLLEKTAVFKFYLPTSHSTLQYAPQAFLEGDKVIFMTSKGRELISLSKLLKTS